MNYIQLRAPDLSSQLYPLNNNNKIKAKHVVVVGFFKPVDILIGLAVIII